MSDILQREANVEVLVGVLLRHVWACFLRWKGFNRRDLVGRGERQTLRLRGLDRQRGGNDGYGIGCTADGEAKAVSSAQKLTCLGQAVWTMLLVEFLPKHNTPFTPQKTRGPKPDRYFPHIFPRSVIPRCQETEQPRVYVTISPLSGKGDPCQTNIMP